MLNYISKPYEVYQHLLILKSCADLQKFDLALINSKEELYLGPVSRRVVGKLPPLMLLL